MFLHVNWGGEGGSKLTNVHMHSIFYRFWICLTSFSLSKKYKVVVKVISHFGNTCFLSITMDGTLLNGLYRHQICIWLKLNENGIFSD